MEAELVLARRPQDQPQVANPVIGQPQVLFEMIVEPGMPSDSLEMRMSADGLQNPAKPSKR